MTRKAWDKLKRGSIIKSARSGVMRKVIEANGHGSIVLVMIRSGTWRMWSGHYNTNVAGVDKTVYCAGDKKQFEVHRY